MTKPDEEIQTKYKQDRLMKEVKRAEYPNVYVERDASGLTRVYNEEPGNETIEEYHISGRVRILFPDGSIMEASPGESKVEYGSSSVTIKHNQDVSVGGHSKTHVEGGLWLEVVGTTAITGKGDATINIMGHVGMAVDGNLNLGVKGNLNLDAQGDMTIKAKGGIDLGADGGIKLQGQTIAMQQAGDGVGGYRS